MVLLTDLADVLRTTGRPVIELPNWKRNYHSGLFEPEGNLWHHTGSYDGLADADNDLDYAEWLAFRGRPDLSAPLCNVAISAEGWFYLCSSGRAYHAGDARASGPVPAGNGNGLYIGWECMNSGSQGWGKAQRSAMVAGAAVTSKHYGWSAAANRGHRETSVTGKWDPGLLNLADFREDVSIKMKTIGKDWFDMATKKELREVVEDAVAKEFQKEINRDKNVKQRDRKRYQRLRALVQDNAAAIAALDEIEQEDA